MRASAAERPGLPLDDPVEHRLRQRESAEQPYTFIALDGTGEVIRDCHETVTTVAAPGAAPPRSRGGGRLPVGRIVELEATALPGRLDVQVHEPDGLLLGAAARPRDARTGDRHVRSEPPLTPAAMAAAVSGDTAPCSCRMSSGTPSSAILTSFAYATIPPRKTSLEPGTDVSRAATSPPVHDSAVPA